MVQVIKHDGYKRDGRGFSRPELKQAGLSPKLALRNRIPVDLRRKSSHEENVKELKEKVSKK